MIGDVAGTKIHGHVHHTELRNSLGRYTMIFQAEGICTYLEYNVNRLQKQDHTNKSILTL